MSYTYVLSTNVGKIRNLIGDNVEASALLTDEEITSLLSLRDSDIFLTAALALRRIAASKVLVARRRKAGNFDEDTKDLIKNYLEVAKQYEQMANEIPADAQVEIIYDNFSYNNIINNRAYRGETE